MTAMPDPSQPAVRRRLWLMRHAKSSWADPNLPDHDRPLSARGRRAAAALARHLPTIGAGPELVLCSSAARTVETLDRIRSGLPDDSEVVIDRGIYGASMDAVLSQLGALSGEVGSALVIGHNPTMQDIALALAADEVGPARDRMETKFPTAALARFSFTADWSQLGPGVVTLEDFVVPSELPPG